MPRKKSTTKSTTNQRELQPELFRAGAMLLVGVLVVMTFLLTIGLQKPSANFELFFNSTVVLLGLGLFVYGVGSMFNSSVAKARLALLQQVVFVLSVLSLSVFTLVAANVFFSPAPVQQAPASAAEQVPVSEEAPAGAEQTAQ